MTIIFNAILRIQYFSKLWKLAQIIMLPKPGKDSHQTASYRPISLLPVFSKILEKIIYDRIKRTIEKKKLIPDHQFGFRNKHSTIEQMHRLINEIILALENKQYCTALFMDIEKAFDKQNKPRKPTTNNQETIPGTNTPINKILLKQQNLRNKNQGHIL